jgi:hypothetical protein
MRRLVPASSSFALLLIALLAPAALGWDRTAPGNSEEPPWGKDRFQHVGVHIGVEFAAPFMGNSGDDSAAYTPAYAEGWLGGTGGFGDLAFFFCPGHQIYVSVERFAFASAGPVTVQTPLPATDYEYGDITGTGVAFGYGLVLPLTLETELWTNTLAPTTAGPVVYGRVGVGIAMLDELSLTITPTPAAGDSPWWDAGAVAFGHAAVGFEYRFFRYVGVFVEVAACGILPDAEGGGSALVYTAFRGGVSVLFL